MSAFHQWMTESGISIENSAVGKNEQIEILAKFLGFRSYEMAVKLFQIFEIKTCPDRKLMKNLIMSYISDKNTYLKTPEIIILLELQDQFKFVSFFKIPPSEASWSVAKNVSHFGHKIAAKIACFAKIEKSDV